ncbi:MAG: DMT family transporter [Candidatus Anstonellales archaeon]
MANSDSKEKILGFAYGILGAITYGMILIFTKLAYQAGADTFSLLRDRFGLSALLLWGYYFLFLKRKISLNIRTGMIGLTLGAMTYGTMVLAYFYALHFISASLTALILYLAPTITTLLAKIFLKESITLKKAGALLLPFLGASLIIGPHWETLDSRGFILAFTAVFLSSFYIIILQKILKIASPQIMSILIITGAAIFYFCFRSPFTFLSQITRPGISIPFFLLVFISTIPPIFLSISAIEKIGGVRTIMLSPLDPLTTLVAAYFILGERLTLPQILGGCLIMIGVFLVYKIK